MGGMGQVGLVGFDGRAGRASAVIDKSASSCLGFPSLRTVSELP